MALDPFFLLVGEPEASAASDCCDSGATRSNCTLIQGFILQLLRRDQHRSCRPDPVANSAIACVPRRHLVFLYIFS